MEMTGRDERLPARAVSPRGRRAERCPPTRRLNRKRRRRETEQSARQLRRSPEPEDRGGREDREETCAKQRLHPRRLARAGTGF